MSAPTILSRYRFLLIVAAILLVGLILRLRGLETTGLWGDQAFTLNTAMRWVNGGEMPLAANKSSVGFVNPPMIEYLYAAALAVWPDVLSVSVLTLLGGLLAVAVTGWVTARLFGRRAGLWAMLAFAVAPWAVFWSQLIWNQTMVPPFAALALGGLLLYLAGRPRAVYLLGAFAAAAAMTQVHPGSAVQLLTMAIALLLFRRRVDWRHVLAGAAVFAALYLPYLIYQIGTGWADIRAMGDMAGQETTFSSAAALLSLDLIRSQGLYRAVPGVVRFDYLAAGLFIATSMLAIWRWWQPPSEQYPGVDPDPTTPKPIRLDHEKREPAGDLSSRWSPERVALIVMWLWFLMPLLFYLRTSVYLQNYYLVGQWPAHFMILGIGLDTAQREVARRAVRASTPVSRRLWPVAGLVLPAIFAISAAFQVYFSFRYQDARTAGDGPDMQVRHARAMITTSRELLAQADGWRLAGIGRGHQVENSNLALLKEFVDPERVLLADGDLALPLPSPYAYYLDTRPGSPASATLNEQAYRVPGVSIQVKDQEWPYFQWTEPELGTPVAPLASWSSGLELIDYYHGAVVPGQELELTLSWRVTQTPPMVQYHFGTYLLDGQDVVWAQHDGPGFDSVQWRAGDSFITYHRLTVPAGLPEGDYRLAAALYTWPDVIRVDLAGGGNTAYLDLLPPILP